MAIDWSAVKTKVIATVLGAVLIAGGSGLWWAASSISSNIVWSEDLTGFADMVIQGVNKKLDERLGPIESELKSAKALAEQNAADIKKGRLEQIDQAMRDLRIEIQQMEDEKAANPSTWRDRDDALLEEWRKDLKQYTCERADLMGSRVPPDCF